VRVIAFLRRNWLEVAWGVFAITNLAAMILFPRWETIPFHFIWVSLTLLYGFRVLDGGVTIVILSVVMLSTGIGIVHDAQVGTQPWDEISEVPLMAAMFLAMVWHAQRRMEALRIVEERAEERRSLLKRQERFIHDASHELRTPLTSVLANLELLSEELRGDQADTAQAALRSTRRM